MGNNTLKLTAMMLMVGVGVGLASGVAPAVAQVGSEEKEESSPVSEESGDEVDGGEADDSAETVGGKVIVIGRPVDVDRIAGSANVVGREQLEAFEYDDITKVLQEVPGVYLRTEDGFGLRPNIGLRGANSDRSAKVTLMEDGILLTPAPYSAPAAYYFPLTTRMVGIDVFKGPASIQYGPQTIGGAINFRTRAIPDALRGGLDLAAGNQGTGKVHGWWGTSDENWGVLLEGVRLQSEGFKHIDGGGETGFHRHEFMLKGRWNSDLEDEVFHQVEIKLGYSGEKSHETYLGLTVDDLRGDPFRRYAASRNDLMEYWRTQAEVRYTVIPTDSLEIAVTAYRNDMHREWNKLNGFRGGLALQDILLNPTAPQAAVLLAVLRGDEDSTTDDQALMIGTNDRSYVSQGVQAIANWRPEMPWAWFTQEIELGVRLHYDSIDRYHWEDAFLMRSGSLVKEGTDRVTTARNVASTLALATYLTDTIGLGDFLVTPGLRVEYIRRDFDQKLTDGDSRADDVVLIPGVGVSYHIADWTILGGVHKGFSPVSPGQPDGVKPEESINYEGGFRFAPEEGHVEVIGFFSDYKNLTGECTFSTGCSDADLNRQFNGGRVWVYGLEFAGSYQADLGAGFSLGVSASYTLTSSEFRTSFDSDYPQFDSVEQGDALPYVPVHQAAGLLGFGWRDLSVNAAFTFVDEMRDTAGSGTMGDGEGTERQYLLDFAASYAFFDDVSLYARAENVLDQGVIAALRPFGPRPIRPFLFQVGIKIGFDG